MKEIIKKKAEYYSKKFEELISSATYVPDIYKAILNSIEEFKDHLYTPISSYKDEIFFNRESIESFVSNSSSDVEIQLGVISQSSLKLNNVFNYNQDFKTSLKNEIADIKYNFDRAKFRNNTSEKITYIQEPFSNYSGIDTESSGNTQVDILTSEGIMTLKSKSSSSISNIKSIIFSGNGNAGNAGVLRIYDPSSLTDSVEYLKYTIPNDNINALIDDEAATIFEYQSLKEPLRLDIQIEFKDITKINWLEILAYIPDRAKDGFMIDTIEIKDSSNGELVSIKINSKISLLPNKGNNNQINLGQQGIINFPVISTRSISIKLSQNNWYKELIGETIYKKNGILVNPNTLPSNILNGPIGQYTNNGSIISKDILKLDSAHRYSIGIRGLDLLYKEFEEESIFISKSYDLENKISKIKLYANEYIPSEFISDISSNEQWIEYYVQFNNSEWMPISPDERILIKDKTNAPKCYLINSKDTQDVRNISSFGYIDSELESQAIRVKIVLKRPAGKITLSPIIDQYTLACEE